MATKWDALWDDEDWWKKQSRTALYTTYKDIQKEEDKLKFRNKMMLSSVDADKSIWTAYDLLSFVQVAEEAGFQYTTDVDETKDIRREDIEALAVTRLQALEKNSEKNLSYYLRAKALKEVISKTTSSDDNDRDILKTSIYTDTKKIEEQLPQTEATLEQTLEFYDANDSGALEGISDEVKQAFLKKIEQTFGWNLVNAEQVKANDAHLNNNINLSVKINDDAGNEIINPIYAECVDIPLSFDYPEGISDEKKQQLAHLYKSQLLANAAQRATMELMRNPKLISEAQTKEDLVAKFADVVKQKYQYSVVMAALVSDEDLGKKIKFDSKTMQLVADDTNDADIQNILVKLKNNETQLNPDVIAIDTTALKWEIENAERIMKTKHIDVDALPFWKKVSGAVLGGWNHITKCGGWKNLSVNVLANGGAYIGATILIGKGAAAVVAAGVSTPAVAFLAGGYALYAGWSYVSAKKMPAINKLISEANEQKLSFKDTMKYAWKNFSRARKEKEAEAEFKSRSNFRVGEGVIGGAATTAGALFGNPWIKGITSAAGKATLLIKSGFNLKKDRKKFRENVTLDNYNKMKTSENYVTQDAVSLTAVLAGRFIAQNLFGDAPSSDGSEPPVVTEVEETSSLTGNNGTGGNSVKVSSLLERQVQSQDFSNVNSDTNATSIKVVNDALVAEAEIDGYRVSVPVEYDQVTGRYIMNVNGNGVVIAHDGQKGIELTEQGANLKMSASEVVDATEVVSKPIDIETLSNYEKRMYLNSIKQWDNNALENRIAEMEKNGIVVDAQTKQSLVEAMGDNQVGKGIVQGFYDKIMLGKVESCPQGVDPIMYIDKLTRLAQLAPVVHKDAIGIMIKDLSCDEFVPNAEQIALVNNALNTIVYQKGSMECIIPDADGNLCLKTAPMFGQYIGEQQMAKIEINGEVKELPLRTANETTGLYSKVDCGQNGVGKVVSTYVVHQIPGCGCEKEPIPTEYTFEVDQNHTVLGEILKDNRDVINVNFADPKNVHAEHVYDPKSGNYKVEPTINNDAQYMSMDSDGNIHLWQQGATVAKTELRSGAEGIETVHQTALNLNMDNLGAATINDGEKLISFQYGEGKHALSFVLNKENGEMHSYIGKVNPDNEVILDQATTQKAISALTATMHESNLDSKYNFVFDAETENNNERFSEYANEFAEKKADVESKYNQDIQKGIAKASKRGVTTTHFDTPDNASYWQSTAVTPDQQAALLSNKAIINSDGTVTNGQMNFTVQGVEGLDKFTMPAVRNFVLDADKQPQIVADFNTVATSEALHKIKLEVPSANGNNIFVEVNIRGSYTRVFDENGPVLLDKSSSENIGNACVAVLKERGLNVKKLNLNPYPEGSLGAKCVGIYNQAVQTKQLQNIITGKVKQ